MSRTLNVDYIQKKICILKGESDFFITFNPGMDSAISFNNGKQIYAGCINCMDPQCMSLKYEEIKCIEFPNISYDMNRLVCPVNAIKSGEESIEIDEKKCIGCGLCVLRCPLGALYLKDSKAKVSLGENENMQKLPVSAEGIDKQKQFIQNIRNVNKIGILQPESDDIVDSIYKKIRKMSPDKQNILARNLLIALGNHAALARQGNVYMRMDGFYSNNQQFGVVEIETGSDMLDVSRAILDDIAVVNARYGVNKEKNHPLAIVLSLPNKRTDYWQVLKDIKDIVKISICTVTFGALLILIWNNQEINDFDRFYVDVENFSIRKVISNILGNNVKISNGFQGILESSK